ncbi:MAG: PIG-L family deacetylase [Acidobacteriota bacterium]|nr:PIG-L family deacetylase [Acidobacteriota bacterium]
MSGESAPVLPSGRSSLRLSSPDVPAGLSVLVMAPHPDDFDEVAVTLRRIIEAGGRLRLAVMSSSANGVEDIYVDPPSDAVKAAVREEEQRRSMDFFGLPPERLSFERLPTGEGGYVLDGAPGREKAAKLLAEDAYDVVVQPHGQDTNPDHRRVCSWRRQAAAVLSRPPAAWLFRDPKTIAMRLDLVTPFGEEEAAWKAELLRFHRSQQERGLHLRGYGLDERILRVNRDTARVAGLAEPYAEGFEIEG